MYREVPLRSKIGSDLLTLPLIFPTLATVSAFVSSTIMAPLLGAAQHILIKALLKEGFQTKLIATKAPCSRRAVQRIRRKRQQPEMPTPRTSHVGRRSCITSSMKNALFDKLAEQPYLYRCEMSSRLHLDLILLMNPVKQLR